MFTGSSLTENTGVSVENVQPDTLLPLLKPGYKDRGYAGVDVT